jgi:L-rhamnose mutarotase
MGIVIRKAFRMSVNAGAEAEYERRHRPIWKDLEDVLLDHGVGTYSIFLDEASHELFGYVEVDSDERWARVAGTEVCQRWWRHMRDVMPSNEDHSPVSRDLREVFHIEGTSGSREADVTPVAAPKGAR